MRKDLYYNVNYFLIFIIINLRIAKTAPVKRRNWRVINKKRLIKEIKGKMPSIRILSFLKKINAYIYEIITVISEAAVKVIL